MSSACVLIESARFPWFGIRTKSNFEKIAKSALEAKGFETYVPLYRSRRRRSDRTVISDLPLFPGYVFCRFDPHYRMPVMTARGVISIIGFGDDPVPIPDQEIEAVRRVLICGQASEPHLFLREGQRVLVRYGSLEGIEGILLKKKSDWRLVISINLLQRSLAVEVDRDWVTTIA
jgi:transcription elongation factor/antiterminator RfaH